MKTRRIFFLGCILALGFLLVAPSFAQPSDPVCAEVEFFPETGHNVCDQFLEFFNSRGGGAIFGYPITESILENGRQVQYFQRARMEHHPELPPAYHVQLGLLGDYFAPPDKKARIDPSNKPKSNDPERRYFPETGHTAQFSFLEFYDEKGGLDIFGYPVTEFLLENGRVMQYFQRALMEWNPNRGGIVLHNLGEMWVDQQPYLRSYTGPAPQNAQSGETISAVDTAITLHATASVRDAFAGSNAEQTVWVYVNDQNGRPVQGARVVLIAPTLSGNSEVLMPSTDALGHTQTNVTVAGLEPGQLVVLKAIVNHQGLKTEARAHFLVWW